MVTPNLKIIQKKSNSTMKSIQFSHVHSIISSIFESNHTLRTELKPFQTEIHFHTEWDIKLFHVKKTLSNHFWHHKMKIKITLPIFFFRYNFSNHKPTSQYYNVEYFFYSLTSVRMLIILLDIKKNRVCSLRK